MEENYNSEPHLPKVPKTSTDPKSANNTGESSVQDGTDIQRQDEEKDYEKNDEAQEYLEQANNNTAVGNESPVQDGKTMSMKANVAGEFSEDDDEDDEDDDDEPGSDVEVGDDPDETQKKIPIF